MAENQDQATEAEPFDWFSIKAHDGLRTRFRPASRIYSGFFTLVPWINIIILVLAFVLISQSRTIVPGLPVSLPSQPFNGGLRSSLVIVVKSIPESTEERIGNADGGDDGAVIHPLHIVVFFNDTRFNLSESYRIASFRNNVAEIMQSTGETSALIYMDGNVTHEDSVRLAGILRETGIHDVCYVVKSK